jgi:hypothetical protein
MFPRTQRFMSNDYQIYDSIYYIHEVVIDIRVLLLKVSEFKTKFSQSEVFVQFIQIP